MATAAVSSSHPPADSAPFEALEAQLQAAGMGVSDLSLVSRAYALAADAHAGVERKSGEPYITHPVAVAAILADMQMDAETIAAALLHDVPEDTTITLDDIRNQFGERVARLVDGVTKLKRIEWLSDREDVAKAESLRKMFLAMADDVRVVLIKLADRLHNMRTLGSMPTRNQLATAQETMEIYAPLANRLGIWQIKSELEDLAFRTLEPDRYRAIDTQLEAQGGDRASYIGRVIETLKEALDAAGIPADVYGRAKHLWSIARKMDQKRRTLDEIYDAIAIRVIVPEVKDCYAALGIIHTMWRPIPGEFDDYIASPKESMYQSLHTAVRALDTRPVEVQIRTKEMHIAAEYGIASHWRYKEGGKRDAGLEARVAWLRQLMDWRDEVVDAQAFVETLKSDVFQEMLYVFTPAGDIIELPAGSTPVDFAYRIHSDVGHTCVGAMVNDRLVPLDYKLQNGEMVKIMTSRAKVGPSRDWLMASSGYVHTAQAREKIRQWFRRQQRDQNIAQGRDMLEKELKRLGVEIKLEEIAKQFARYNRLDDFLAAIGYGAVSTQQIAQQVSALNPVEPTIALPPTEAAPRPATASSAIEVMGVGDLLTRLATCCKPVPGDEIIGYVTRGKGITVHRTDCPNVLKEPEQERLVPVSWGNTHTQSYPVGVRLEAWDRVGLMRDVSSMAADEKINLLSINSVTHPDRTVTMRLTVEVGSVESLSRILQRFEQIRDIYEVRRDTPIISKGARAAD
jgi:GTP diphosphokinase / guanosine-3',5'-bis(diphosphate) 3'-diphosphatase